jgi:hypothetical protein
LISRHLRASANEFSSLCDAHVCLVQQELLSFRGASHLDRRERPYRHRTNISLSLSYCRLPPGEQIAIATEAGDVVVRVSPPHVYGCKFSLALSNEGCAYFSITPRFGLVKSFGGTVSEVNVSPVPPMHVMIILTIP